MKRTKAAERRKPVKTDLIVGANVRACRQSQGYTLAEAASALGISHQQLQKYETGHNRISAGTLVQLSNYLGVPLEALFEDPAIDKPSPKDELSRARQRCHSLIDRTLSLETLLSMAKVLRALPGD